MNDSEFVATARSFTIGFLAACQHRGMTPDDVTAVAGAALGEVLAQTIGPVGAVERLRTLADTFERQLLDDMH